MQARTQLRTGVGHKRKSARIARREAITMPRLIRLCWRAAATVLAVLLTAVLIPLVALFADLGKIQPFDWSCRMLARAIIRAAGADVDLHGLENIDNVPSFVLVANHQSVVDVLAILARFPRKVRFVAKKELCRIPVLGSALKNGGHFLVDRERGGLALRKALEHANDGYCIVFFPEGRRFSDGRVHRFNHGAAWFALLTKMPCVPMAIDGSAALTSSGCKMLIPGRTIHLTIGKPIPTEDLQGADRDQLTRQLEQTVCDLFAGDHAHRPPSRVGARNVV
jgi:1-acyl-sn-glycerol-3-phosphate acyltransferase